MSYLLFIADNIIDARTALSTLYLLHHYIFVRTKYFGFLYFLLTLDYTDPWVQPACLKIRSPAHNINCYLITEISLNSYSCIFIIGTTRIIIPIAEFYDYFLPRRINSFNCD